MELFPILIVVLVGVVVYFHTSNPHMMASIRRIQTGKSGCLPTEGIDNITLHYFRARARGEPIRLLMEDAGLTWQETAFTRETWSPAKPEGIKSGLYTFGQVPAIESASGFQLAQTVAILRRLGRASGYDCDCDDYAWCDVLTMGVEDQLSKLGKVAWDPNLSPESRQAFLKEARTWLGYYEKHAPAGTPAEGRGYFTSDGRIAYVDFHIFNMIDVHKSFAEAAMEGDTGPVDNFLPEFPNLSAFYQRFAERPNVAAFLASERRHPYSLPKKS